ncbi:MAG: S1C family serine protease [Chloroflexi bacterium]|nr:S1C family serine protease [Chloroflexota bacterium]
METTAGVGTGFIYNEDGWILTSASVVGDSTGANVFTASQGAFLATVVGVNENYNLAVLKFETSAQLETLDFGSALGLSVGDGVVVFGYEEGSASNASSKVWEGSVDSFTEASGVEYIRTAIASDPTSNGGPLVNAQGNVVGINTLDGIAISIDFVQDVLSALEGGQVVRIVPTPTSTPDISGWDQYDSGGLWFDIKVAPGWTINETVIASGVRFTSPGGEATLEVFSTTESTFTLSGLADREQFTREQQVSGFSGTFELVTRETLTHASGDQTIHLLMHYLNQPSFCDRTYTTYVFLISGFKYVMTGTHCSNLDSTYLSVIQNMQDSFDSWR